MDIRNYIPKHFTAEELVPREEIANWLLLMDTRVLITLDKLREHFNVPITVNTPELQFRGYRPWSWVEQQLRDGRKVATRSQHLYGRAIDCTVKGITAEAVRQEILHNRDVFPYITVLEEGVSWVHFDVRNTGRDTITLINP